MTLKSVSYYFQRGRELGPRATLQRLTQRATTELGLWSQSLWWRWRARRQMSDAALLARTTGGWRSLDAFLEHLASRPGESFVLPHDSAEETAAILRRHFPEYLAAVLAAADASCRNELSLLGEHFTFPRGIDWQRDPITGWRWPLVHRTGAGKYLGSERPVDLIVFWELNRHQHFVTLGIAFWLTGDQRYVQAFGSHIQSWIEANPPQLGVNWYYGLEVSIRILAWTVALQFFRSSPLFRDQFGKPVLKSLWQQADFLSTHLQTARAPRVVPNNHLLAELTGLAVVGAAFPEFRKAAAWRDTALQLLTTQVPAQTHADGVNKEQATGYHRFIAELLLLVVARMRRGALPHAPVLEATLQRMLDYMLFTSMPTGRAPMWGDSDYGRALGLGQHKDFWDFRPILAAGAALFGRPDWKFVAGRFDEEAFWLLGVDGLRRWERLAAHPPDQTSQGFPEAGLYVIRDAWAADTDVGVFRCGPFGLGGEGQCAHAHCDLLSFVLWVKGQPLLVDSGTYMYSGPWRNHFKLTAAHNTVRIDGHDQAAPVANFNWRQVPEARSLTWTGDRVTGALCSRGKVEFIRELAHPRPGVWELVDTFNGQETTVLEWFFHFAPGLDLHLRDDARGLTVLKDGQPFLTVQIPDSGVAPQVADTWFSDQYGVKHSNRTLTARWEGDLQGGASFPWQFRLVNGERAIV